MSRDGARLVIDGMQVAKTGPPFAQVCGSPGNAVRYDRGSLGLRAGLHLIHLEGLHFASQGAPRVLWEGPGIRLTEVPPDAYVHPRVNVRAGDGAGGFNGPRTGVSVIAPAGTALSQLHSWISATLARRSGSDREANIEFEESLV